MARRPASPLLNMAFPDERKKKPKKKAAPKVYSGRSIVVKPGQRSALPLTSPLQTIFPGASASRVPPPRKRPGSPHPSVGSGERTVPAPSHNAGPKQVVVGNGKTQETLPPHARTRAVYGGGSPRAAKGKPTVTPKPGRQSIVRGSSPPASSGGDATRAFTPVNAPASTDPFAGMTPQQIVAQMLAPQYAPIDAQQKEENRLYQNQQGTFGDFGALSTLAGSSTGTGAIPPEFIAALAAQGDAEGDYQHSVNLEKIQASRQEIAAQAPKLMYDLYTAQTEQQRADAEYALKEAQAANTALYQQQQVAIKDRAATSLIQATQKKFGLEVVKTKASITQAADKSSYNWARLTETQRNNKVNAYLSNGRNQISLQRAGVSGRAEQRKWAELELKARSGGITPSARRSLQKAAGGLARDAYRGVEGKNPDGTVGTFHKSYQEAMADMLASGIPLAIAQRALNQYWSKPGQYEPDWEGPGEGRPKLSFQERQAINAASRKGKKRGKR